MISENKKQGSKLDSMNQPAQELSYVRQQYQELLEIGMQCDDTVSTTEIPNTISGQFCRSSGDIETQQWNQVWTRLVSMITRYVPFPSVQTETGADKRAILVDLVSKLCDKVENPEENEKFRQLQKKYSRAKKRLHHLHVQCEALRDAVHQNAKDLKKQMKETEEFENDNIVKKLEELTDILSAQLKQEKYIIKESRQRKSYLHDSLSKMQKSRRILSSDSDDQLEIGERSKPKSKDVSMIPEDELANSKMLKSHMKSKTKSKLICNDYDDAIPQKKSRKKVPTRSQLFGESSSEEYLVHIKKRRHINSDDERSKKHNIYFSESSSDNEHITPYSQKKIQQKCNKSVQKSTKILNQLSSSSSDEDFPTILSSSSEEENRQRTKSFSKTMSSKVQTRSKVCFPDSDSDSGSKAMSKSLRVSQCNDISGSPKRSLRGIRERCGRHVNELVEVANGLREDYKRIRRVFSDDTSSEDEHPSISKISYINDSVVKPRPSLLEE